MYGTVARLAIKPGKLDELTRLGQEMSAQIPGLVSEYVFRTDANADELYLVVIFESERAYRDNASSPEQHARYEQYRALLAADPEWHDGHVVDVFHNAAVAAHD
ncbi:MAG: antibiotic biosynthesis monooxygenase [Thermomicrobiales bacterium]|nr:antibiotic biosynthesis monooxygenase [Thermomicrobiales bacterium]